MWTGVQCEAGKQGLDSTPHPEAEILIPPHRATDLFPDPGNCSRSGDRHGWTPPDLTALNWETGLLEALTGPQEGASWLPMGQGKTRNCGGSVCVISLVSLYFIRFGKVVVRNGSFITVASEARARDSKYIEQLGSFDPLPNIHNEKLVSFNYERIKYWIGCGAHPTKPVAKLLGLAGFFPLHPMTVTQAERRRNEAAALVESVNKEQDPGQEEV
ncbi:hypothetical protein GJAV_G00176170 [Gymnothorax javanicus]|nr:hypothetical protein GJAV_G00176170 [Gymnothorax javanicus]